MPNSLPKTPVHQSLGATVVVEPPFTGMDWYEAYGSRHQEDGKEGRPVSMHIFDAPWDSWEMHPARGTRPVHGRLDHPRAGDGRRARSDAPRPRIVRDQRTG